MKKVKAIETKNGVTVFNLAASEANDDWIRAARLLKEGNIEEFEKMDAKPMFTETKTIDFYECSETNCINFF